MDFTPRAPLRVAVLAAASIHLRYRPQIGAVDHQVDLQFDIKRFTRRQSVV
ncbi:MAG: hypothetical protein E5299_01656 [Burkholderia gladioli]|nr:MAG: hypothetical protein E5299_01656 [Burkholderia gladioli]